MPIENNALGSSPIIEAVVDIDCDVPPPSDLDSFKESAKEALSTKYPEYQEVMFEEHQVIGRAGAEAAHQVRQGLSSLQFLTEDKAQLVQFRPNGFSFNRLAPYTSFEAYLPEVERSWKIFQKLAEPSLIRKVSIRTINKIELPFLDGQINLKDHLAIYPSLPNECSLGFEGFFERHIARDSDTGHQAIIVKTTESAQANALSLILDIEVSAQLEDDPANWERLSETLASLRSLKNRIFKNTLTPSCLSQFSLQP